jgi:hypothetical protein
MADVEWRPLATLRPEPAVWTDVGELMLLMFTQDGVPTWEVSRRVKVGSSRDDLIANGAADIIEAAKLRHSSKQRRVPQNEECLCVNGHRQFPRSGRPARGRGPISCCELTITLAPA